MGIAEVGNGLTIIQVKELPYLDSIHEFTSQSFTSSESSEAKASEEKSSEGADITALVQSASSLAIAAWPPQELADLSGNTVRHALVCIGCSDSGIQTRICSINLLFIVYNYYCYYY